MTVAPYDSTERVALPLQKPNQENILGTNDLGQDLLSELIAGTRASLFTGIIVSFIAVLIGTVIGIASGYLGGWVDSLLMRTHRFDPCPSFSSVGDFDQRVSRSQPEEYHYRIVHFLLGGDPRDSIRARVLGTRSDTYIEAARALGASPLEIMARTFMVGCETAGTGADRAGGFRIHPRGIEFELFGSR